jgi:hypothetical protein
MTGELEQVAPEQDGDRARVALARVAAVDAQHTS